MPGEMLAVAASRMIGPDDVCVVGLGLPQIAAVLAKRTHAAQAELLLEIGVFEPEPCETAMGIADPRMWAGADAFGGMLDILGGMLHGGRVTLGLLGALQVDPWGSINTTSVTNEKGEVRRFNGSGGGNDIASLAGRVLVLLKHHPRKFRERVEFLTSPGHLVGGRPRAAAGLVGDGTVAIVTDRAIIDITAQGAVLRAIHPGESLDAVLAATPMPIEVPDGGPDISSPPDPASLEMLRTELDPQGWYTS